MLPFTLLELNDKKTKILTKYIEFDLLYCSYTVTVSLCCQNLEQWIWQHWQKVVWVQNYKAAGVACRNYQVLIKAMAALMALFRSSGQFL